MVAAPCRWLLPALLALPLLLAACSTAAPSPANPTDGGSSVDRSAEARGFVELLQAGDTAGAVAQFDETMRQALPEAQLAELWKSLQEQVGPFKEIIATRQEQQQGYDVIFVTTAFERSSIDIKVVYDSHGRVAGLFFLPAGEVTTPQAGTKNSVADYVQPERFEELEVTVGEGDWRLPGTLSLPKGAGPFPAVILVHGSGPNDRDETVGPNKPFRDLAWGLASQGIAVLRYEKRTKVYGAELAALPDLTVREETIDDALAAVQLLRRNEAVDPARVFVLGHSLGGMLAPRIGSADQQIAGLIILAGLTRPLADSIVEQYHYIFFLDGSISSGEQQQLDALERQRATINNSALTTTTPLSETMGVPASYWLDLRDYHPVTVAASLPQPLLILQGERDYQVTMEDFNRWSEKFAGSERATLKSYSGLNHLFIEGTGRITPEEYQVPGHVSEQVVDDLAAWIKR